MLKVVFFDAAGTLFDTHEPVGSIYARLARRFGLEAPDSVVDAAFRRAFRASPGLAFGPGHSPDELRRLEKLWWRDLVWTTFEQLGRFDDFERFFEALFAHFADPKTWRVDPEALGVFEALKERRLRLGIISNFDWRLYGVLEACGMLRYVDSVTISSEVGYAKPAPEIFQAALAKHDLAPNQALHVGDSLSLDVGGALSAGIPGLLLDRRGRHLGQLRGAVGCARSLAEVLKVVDEIESGTLRLEKS
jgi:putative hydrolase of the HAD superfamily